MIRTSPRQQIIIIISALSIGVVLVVFLVLVPAIRQIRDVRRSITSTQNILEQQRNRTKHMRQAMNNLAEVKKTVADYELAAIRRGEELSVITTLERLAAEQRISQKLSAVFSGGEVAVPFYTFSFMLQGDFAQIRAYIGALEALPYYVIIDTLRFEKKTAGEIQPLTVQFDGKVYTRPESVLIL